MVPKNAIMLRLVQFKSFIYLTKKEFHT